MESAPRRWRTITSYGTSKQDLLRLSAIPRIQLVNVADPLPLCILMCGGSHMATNLSIDPELIERALEVSGERTKKAAVTKALQEFIARRKQKRLLELMGKLEWDQSYDYKSERSRS
jgi:Arc/MetJ family transcription regulator